MRRAALVLGTALAALAAGCGGGSGSSSGTTGTTAAPKDPGLAVMSQAVGAVRSGDRPALWRLLSVPSQRRLGPTLSAFRRSGAQQLEHELRPFAAGAYREVVSQRVTGRFGVVAIASGRNAFAAALRREREGWKLELGRGSLRIASVLPPPGSVSRVVQLAFELHGPQAGVIAVLYADGRTLDGTEYTAPRSATIVANLVSPLPRGAHVGVAFATGRDQAVAESWRFLAR